MKSGVPRPPRLAAASVSRSTFSLYLPVPRQVPKTPRFKPISRAYWLSLVSVKANPP